MALTLQPSELTPLVALALGKTSVEILEWRGESLAEGGSVYSGGKGLFRVTGMAQDSHGIHPWSMILKIASSAGQFAGQEPGSRNYWRREADAYQSGLLNDLPGGDLRAPLCWAVQDRPGHEAWIWLEDVPASTARSSMERYYQSARHLGHFNGAYLAGYPLPAAQPWMTRGRTRVWIADVRSYVPKIHDYMASPLVQRWYGRNGVERTLQVWDDCEQLLGVFDRLPACYCHHDAHYRNLLEARRSDGTDETVAIDWALTGFGRIGEEVGVTLGEGLGLLDVAAGQANELDQTIFSGYIDGLHEMGWAGDVRLARLGYTVNACLGTVLGNYYWLYFMETEEGVATLESFIGQPLEAMIDQWTETLPFCLDLGDEARELAALDLLDG